MFTRYTGKNEVSTMGCLRLGVALLTSLLVAAILTTLGGVAGAVIFFLVGSHGGTPSNLSAPGLYLGGGVGLLLGLLVMRASLKRAATVNWLRGHGRRITAHVVAVETQWVSTQVPGGAGVQMVPLYVMVAHWMDPSTHQQHTFRSQPTHRKLSPGDPIGVRIDPQNMSRYQVEV
jgi:hypothetical protein